MTTEEYRACYECNENEAYVSDKENPEVCSCDDGVDEDGRQMITTGCMREMSRIVWVENNGWNDDDPERRIAGKDVLQEDLQDYTTPRVQVGKDVVNLYPSLDITKVVEDVCEAILESKISGKR